MFSTTVAFRLSTGRMVRFVLSLIVSSAALSVLLNLSLRRDDLFVILTFSCLASSATSKRQDISAFPHRPGCP